MAEMKVTHVLIVLVLVAGVAVVVLAFSGYIAIGWFNQQNLKKMVDQGANMAAGYTPAKTPMEAMDKFREAIQARKYKTAASYCTKAYGEQLERAHDGASQLGEEIDRIERYADNKGIKSEKTAFFLRRLDPFPKNFETGPAPKEDEKDKNKAYGTYIVKGTEIQAIPSELKEMDNKMFLCVLRPTVLPDGKINVELVKEGEEWKLNIPSTDAFEKNVGYFKDQWRTYHTGLHAIAEDLPRETYTTKTGLEGEVVGKLRSAKAK